MKELNDDQLLRDLGEIGRRKIKIRESLEFTRRIQYESQRFRNRRRKIYITGMSVTGLAAALVLAMLLFPVRKSVDSDALFQKHYKKFDPSVLTRDYGRHDSFSTAFLLYYQGNLIESEALTDSLLLALPGNDKLIFLKGLISLDKGETEKASRSFTAIIPGGGVIEAYARWYLALIYLKMGEFSFCREQLDVLRNANRIIDKQEFNKLYRETSIRQPQ